jgi:hypothetical protein
MKLEITDKEQTVLIKELRLILDGLQRDIRLLGNDNYNNEYWRQFREHQIEDANICEDLIKKLGSL